MDTWIFYATVCMTCTREKYPEQLNRYIDFINGQGFEYEGD